MFTYTLSYYFYLRNSLYTCTNKMIPRYSILVFNILRIFIAALFEIVINQELIFMSINKKKLKKIVSFGD